jgi:isoquinoline 1-oxidoreductase alpha subunit
VASIAFTVNGIARTLDVDPQMPLLWALRDKLGETGTKFGCGLGQCGACTVHMDGRATRSCITTVASAAGRSIVTIEGLSPDGSHPLQKAWLMEAVSQCGYCQPGQIMTAAALLAQVRKPSDDEILAAMSGVLCRCGSYQRILRAVRRAVSEGGGG